MQDSAKICLAIPNTGVVQSELALYLFKAAHFGLVHDLFMPQEKPHDVARNVIVHHFLGTDCTHLLMIDSDVIPPDNITRMVGHDICSAWVNAYKDGHLMPVAMDRVKDGWKQRQTLGAGPNEVDAVGTGCIMVRREVFEKMPAPWFEFIKDERGMLKAGEDFSFCQKAKELGFSIQFDTNYRCVHYCTTPLKTQGV